MRESVPREKGGRRGSQRVLERRTPVSVQARALMEERGTGASRGLKGEKKWENRIAGEGSMN